MRITATLKPNSELEKFIIDQIERTGFSSAQCLVNLALQGMEYKQALSTMAVLAKSVEAQSYQEKQ